MSKINPLITSSGNPNEVSAMIQGILMAIVPIAIQLMRNQGVEVSENQTVEIVQMITGIIAISQMLIGSLRKFVNFTKSLLKR